MIIRLDDNQKPRVSVSLHLLTIPAMELFGALRRNSEDAPEVKTRLGHGATCRPLSEAPCVWFSGVRDGNLIVLDEIGLA